MGLVKVAFRLSGGLVVANVKSELDVTPPDRQPQQKSCRNKEPTLDFLIEEIDSNGFTSSNNRRVD